MTDRVWKCVSFGRSHPLLLNKFCDPSAPSMRNVDDGEEKRKEKKEKRKEWRF